MFDNFFANFKCFKEREKKEGGVDFRKFWWKEKNEDLKVIENLNVKLIINKRILVLCISLFSLFYFFHKSLPFSHISGQNAPLTFRL